MTIPHTLFHKHHRELQIWPKSHTSLSTSPSFSLHCNTNSLQFELNHFSNLQCFLKNMNLYIIYYCTQSHSWLKFLNFLLSKLSIDCCIPRGVVSETGTCVHRILGKLGAQGKGVTQSLSWWQWKLEKKCVCVGYSGEGWEGYGKETFPCGIKNTWDVSYLQKYHQ